MTTSRAQQASAAQRFLSEGITGIIDRSNRRWTFGAYAGMAGRTTVNRAFNDVGIWRMGQAGINLVTAVRGLDSCRKCASWAGKILSADDSPAGPRALPHSTRNQKVTVDVAGTVAGPALQAGNTRTASAASSPTLPASRSRRTTPRMTRSPRRNARSSGRSSGRSGQRSAVRRPR